MERKYAKILKKHKGIVRKLGTKPRALNQYRKLYNELCKKCKVKTLKDPSNADHFCPECKEKYIFRMEKVKRLLCK